ncbi:MAG: Ger(x)C family spore germination C-terminal domain-containing protein, partial [Ruminococcus sp.]
KGNHGTEAFEIDSARTDISVRIEQGIPHVNVKIRIKGRGNGQAAESVITALCKDAERETLKRAKADVIGFGKYLAKDCPEYYAENDFETAKWAAVFEYNVEAE